MYKVLDLFSGIGGFTQGFVSQGFNVIGHIEINNNINKIYETNFPSSIRFGSDIAQLTNSEILKIKQTHGEIDVICGGFPCQGFSLAGKRDVGDKRNLLFYEYARVVDILKPKVILIENVSKLTSMKNKDGGSVLNSILSEFEEKGYNIDYKEINAQDYGIPQSRERVFFLGIRKDLNLKINFPKITHGKNGKDFVTFRDATKDLEILESGEKSMVDQWHFAVKHPKHVIEMLKDVPEGRSAHENSDPSLRPSSGFNTSYKRIKYDEPCSTITTTFGMISSTRNVHPTSTRSFTIREALRIQTFPDSFRLVGNLGDIRTGIGNAVPPKMAEIFALEIMNALNCPIEV